MQNWAEVHRLKRQGMSNVDIAERLDTGRNTVTRLLARSGPPKYERRPAGSMLDPFKDEVRAMLAEDPTVRATVILERLRWSGYSGGISILHHWVRQVRTEFAAAASFQRIPPSNRALRDDHLAVEIRRVFEANYRVHGYRKQGPRSAEA